MTQPRTPLEAATLRGLMLRGQLKLLERTLTPRVRMRTWALRWRNEVKAHGKSEASEGMLDQAIGWRSLTL